MDAILTEEAVNTLCIDLVKALEGNPTITSKTPADACKMGFVMGLETGLLFLKVPQLQYLSGKDVVELMTEFLTITPNP